MSRVLTLGCSHAWGAEAKSAGVIDTLENLNLSFGKLVADSLDLEFAMAARPGVGNDQILYDVIEHVQENDICLVSWTYLDRYLWTARNTTEESSWFTNWHVLTVLSNNLPKYFEIAEKFFKQKKEVRDKHVHANRFHPFMKNMNDPDLIKFCEGQAVYGLASMPKIVNFLKTYHAVDSIIKSRGATPVYLHYDVESDALQKITGMDELDVQRIFPDRLYAMEETNNPGWEEVLFHNELDNTTLLNGYRDDSNFIRWKIEGTASSYKEWYFNNNNLTEWPGDRLGHLDAQAHKELADIILEKLNADN
jgi:hypothetical protein|tara:strand:- start:1231 stop:2151 length:921 start_codon:yes stop_codon:yes gene_type:complete